MDLKAVIFDLDGTLVDNNAFHLQAWKQYLKNMGREITDEEYNANFNGRTNKDVVEYIHNRKMSNEEAAPFYLEKEALYRSLYVKEIKPVKGLLSFLDQLQSAGISMAIATSGIIPNIDFLFEHVPIKHYFKTVVHSAHIKKGKPDPEIYTTAAALLKVDPKNCLAFEDAVVGIDSAKAAGMKVIALATTHHIEELKGADKIIMDYTEIDLNKLRSSTL